MTEKERIVELEKAASNLLALLGEDISRPGLKDTPNRMARMWIETFQASIYPESKPVVTVFDNNDDGISYDQMVIDTGKFFSHCEHHAATIRGTYYFGYIPDKKIVGLSKIARIIKWYASKFQVQERLGTEVVEEFNKLLNPKGIILVLDASHDCKEIRGVKELGIMTTSHLKGVFETDGMARAEFLQLIKRKN